MNMQELKQVRNEEYLADLVKANNSFDAYWAGSASASLVRDVKAGRVENIYVVPRKKRASQNAALRNLKPKAA